MCEPVEKRTKERWSRWRHGGGWRGRGRERERETKKVSELFRPQSSGQNSLHTKQHKYVGRIVATPIDGVRAAEVHAQGPRAGSTHDALEGVFYFSSCFCSNPKNSTKIKLTADEHAPRSVCPLPDSRGGVFVIEIDSWRG